MSIPQTDTIGAALTVAMADLMTVPANSVRYFTMVQVASVDPANDVDVTLQWTDSSNADAVTRLAYQVTVAKKNGLEPLTGAFALQAGDKLQGLASADNSAEITITYFDKALA